MAACARCGYGNPDVAEFCENPDCRADLRPLTDPPSRAEQPVAPLPRAEQPVAPAPWIEQPTAPPPSGLRVARGASRTSPSSSSPRSSQPPPASAPPRDDGPPPGEQRRGVRVTMEPAELRVEPGGPPVSATVTVRNKCSRVDDFLLTVNGPVAGFAQVHPPVLHVFPDTEQTAEVRFRVPRAPHPAAARYSFQVVARARVHADVSGKEVGGLTVGRFDDMVASIEPEMTRGRSPGNHRLTVTNRGNGPLDVRVALADQQGELSFTPQRFGGVLAPGASATEKVVVGAPVKFFGRTQVHSFAGTVDTDVRGQTARVQALRRQVPRFPWWIPTVAMALVALTIALYAVWPGTKVPPVKGQDVALATATLTDEGYEKVVPVEQVDAAVAAGTVIDTEPKATTEHPTDKPVLLLVSKGPCTGACPIKIPVVSGLLVAEATSALAAAGFVVDRVNQVPDQRAAGTVVGTQPPGGQEVSTTEKVVIDAAIGPTAPTAAPPSAGSSGGGPSGAQGPGGAGAQGPGGAGAQGPGASGGSGGGGPSGGPGSAVTIPPLAGKRGPEAVTDLTALGLKVQQVRTRSNAKALDMVIGTTPAAGEQVAPGSPVTVELAVPTAVDLVAAAPAAVWSDEQGGVAFGPPAVPSGPVVLPVPARGSAFVHPETTVLEDGVPSSALAMEPAPGGAVRGAFTLPGPVIAGDRVRALVGVLPGAAGSVEFSVTSNGRLLDPVITDDATDGALTLIEVDLAQVVGATALQISVKAPPGSTDNRAFLKDLRIEGLTG